MAASTTIRVTQRAKRDLERLRASLQKATQRKVTQQEAAELAFNALAERPELLASADDWKPLSAKDRAHFAAMQADYGEWSISEIDDVIAAQADPSYRAHAE